MPELNVHYLPQFVAEADLAGSTVIVVDLLRASTTICQALWAGAESVIPCVEISEAIARANESERKLFLLGGERKGQKIEGFHLSNSPSSYTPVVVFGQTIFFTTTNGTKAIEHARLAERVLIGAAVNRQAVVNEVADAERVDILCAGTGGKVTREDILAAGAIVDLLTTHHQPLTTNEWADASVREWQELVTTARALGRSPSEQFAVELRDTLGGKNLLALGYDDDLVACAQLDTLDAVPSLDRASSEIKLL